MITMSSSSQEIIVIAHRGASGYEPENTLRSFRRALELKAQMIELDVHLCQSGQLVVIHDATIDRTTNGTGQVRSLTWDTLKQYDAGKGEHIPLLSEVFDLINQRAIINIELKTRQTVQPVAALILDYLQTKKWSPHSFIVSSFDHYALVEFNASCPQIKTGAIFEGNPIGHATIVRHAQAQYAIMQYEWITPEFITDAHASSLKVFAYVVDTKSVVEKLKKLDIDGIITNYPDIIDQIF